MLQLETAFHLETKKISKHVSKLKLFLISADTGEKSKDGRGDKNDKGVNRVDLPI
jgi:hypothetical protein